MSAQISAENFRNPRGYEIQSALLKEFERGLDPLHPNESKIPSRILGYGEISTVFEISAEGFHELAFKRMCCFETPDELGPYVEAYLEYNRVLEDEVGLHVPPYGYATFLNVAGRPVFYIIQERLLPASIGNNALHYLAPQDINLLFQLIWGELHKVWAFNQAHADCQVGIDGQISNWAIEGFDPNHPSLSGETTLTYIDTSTPLIRLFGVEQLNHELLLRSAPPYLAWILRWLFLEDVVNRYYNPRRVIIDLLANFYKEQRPELIPELVAAANNLIADEKTGQRMQELTVKEIVDYYREDKLIWTLYLAFRQFDRFVRQKVLHREYPYILPGKIKR